MLEIENSVAVITGGGSGIGAALAKHWVQAGGKVVLFDMDEEALEKTKAELEVDGEVATLVGNVTNENDCVRLAALAIERFGRINLVAPFAGITKDGFMVSTDRHTGKVKSKMSLEQFQSVLDVNLTGVFLTVRECTAQMIDNDCTGLICLVSSIGSLGTAGQINYSSSKASMSVIPKVMTAAFFRQGLAHRLRCVAIAPGYTATEMVKGMDQSVLDKILMQVPISRLIETEEITSLIAELYRNEACAGDVYFIHGGLRLGSRG